MQRLASKTSVGNDIMYTGLKLDFMACPCIKAEIL